MSEWTPIQPEDLGLVIPGVTFQTLEDRHGIQAIKFQFGDDGLMLVSNHVTGVLNLYIPSTPGELEFPADLKNEDSGYAEYRYLDDNGPQLEEESLDTVLDTLFPTEEEAPNGET